MKTTLQFLDLHIHNSWYPMLEQYLDHWQRLTAVTASEVVMERERDGRPTFHVRVSLKVSGPDLHTEANGPTLKAALIEATQDLERQIQGRQTQRVERRASERQLSAASAPRIQA
jgi:ribosome-associated translation inhibitor RaiA